MNSSAKGHNTNRAPAKGRPRPEKTERKGLTLALAEPIRSVTRSAIGTRSIAEASLLTEWNSIVGETIARDCWPRRIVFPKRNERREGTLVLRVKPGHALRIGHQEPVIIARANGFFGYKAVARVRIEQGALPERPEQKRPDPPPLSAEDRASVSADVSGIEDEDLRAALERLGQSLKRGQPKT